MSPHGTPDFWGQGPKSTTYGLNDMAELAVRLGSPMNYDRRGEIVWYTNFDNGGQEFLVSTSGTGAGSYLTSYFPYQGGLSMCLKTGSESGMVALGTAYLIYPVLGGIGLEVTFAADGYTDYINFQVRIHTGSLKHEYNVRFTKSANMFAVKADDGNYHDIGGFALTTTGGVIFTHLKVVFDILTGRYVRLMVNDNTYDISAYLPYTEASALSRGLYLGLQVVNGSSGASVLKLDNVIVTQNEPV